MGSTFLNVERAKEELAQLHQQVVELENRVGTLRETLQKAVNELFVTDRQVFPALQEAALAARIAEVLLSRLPAPSPAPNPRKHYVREREAAEYMGVKVSTVRAWRLLRSKNGPPFVHVGRMVLYPVKALEEHMQERIVPRRT